MGKCKFVIILIFAFRETGLLRVSEPVPRGAPSVQGYAKYIKPKGAQIEIDSSSKFFFFQDAV